MCACDGMNRLLSLLQQVCWAVCIDRVDDTLCAGRSNARVRKAIQLQSSKRNVVGALGSRFSGETQGTGNEPAHFSLRRRALFPKGKRKIDLQTTMLQLGGYEYNGVLCVTRL